MKVKFCFNLLTFLLIFNSFIIYSFCLDCKYTYYIYDGAKGYIKTISNVCNCPSDYHLLISEERKCTNNCKNTSSKYIYRYQNLCYENCPSGTHISYEIEYQCDMNLFCETQGLFYNYEQRLCIETIPNGYYCNDTKFKTIDKCHENCKACEEGPVDDNNNCLNCLESNTTLFYDLGNCTTFCINGHFFDGEINRCKCSSNIACEFCSLESREKNLCITCNNELGYYPKKDDPKNNGSFINCYNDNTISDGYYLNKTSNLYEECFNSCKKCFDLGNETDNKCIKCNYGYSFKDDFKNDHNCYLECPYYYYFDKNKTFLCTNESKCPELFNKYVSPKKKCIDKCSEDNEFKYEYKNNCYENCPKGTELINYNYCKKEICPEETPYLIVETNDCVKKCNISDILYKICMTNNPNINIINNNIEFIRNEIISHNFDLLLENITKGDGNDFLIEEKYIKYQRTSSKNQNSKEYNNVSTIKLGK